MASKFTLYSFAGSQWAQVAHLALAEKGFSEDEYDIKDIDLMTGANFDPEYIKVNPNGTVPSLSSASLEKPIIESTDILRYIDGLRGNSSLVPSDPAVKSKAQAIIDLVHSYDARTDTILLHARDDEEMKGKKASGFRDFLVNRQDRLEKEKAANPSHPFYGPKVLENGSLSKFYTTEIGEEHKQFYKDSEDAYKAFAKVMDKLDSLLVLPYAAGDAVSEADFHVVAWLAHAMSGAGSDTTQIQNFDVLEKLIQKTTPSFAIGKSTREWWANISATPAFKKVFPTLH
ncbi:maleylacetoacetate isomerase [Trichoderma arundinaceum]|uniref:Maleylacetoacetate isomerase n=1 Tax=Trichoderma arundinaceum TaxID=490622 RepID=A0A395N9J9_TRIAR|nr:maleylacetoacetate isomerase [Trichoderma arundinaceum]